MTCLDFQMGIFDILKSFETEALANVPPTEGAGKPNYGEFLPDTLSLMIDKGGEEVIGAIDVDATGIPRPLKLQKMFESAAKCRYAWVTLEGVRRQFKI